MLIQVVLCPSPYQTLQIDYKTLNELLTALLYHGSHKSKGFLGWGCVRVRCVGVCMCWGVYVLGWGCVRVGCVGVCMCWGVYVLKWGCVRVRCVGVGMC